MASHGVEVVDLDLDAQCQEIMREFIAGEAGSVERGHRRVVSAAARTRMTITIADEGFMRLAVAAATAGIEQGQTRSVPAS